MTKKKPKDRLSKFLKDASPHLANATIDAHLKGESPFAALMSTFKRQVFATLAEEAYEWVKEKQGRSVILSWNGDGIELRRNESDGTIDSVNPILMD